MKYSFRLVIATLALLLCACKHEIKQEEEAHTTPDDTFIELTEKQMETIGIRLGCVEQKQLSGTINATGTLKLSPQDRAEVTALVTGITKRILVKEGQHVRAGQTLALVENTEIVALQKDYLITSRQLTLAKQEWQRQNDLHTQGAGIEKSLQQAKAELDMVTATERGMRQQLEQLGISSSEVAQGKFTNAAPVRSPITGVVGEIFISTGSFLNNGTVLMNVYDTRALQADINVFETDIASIHLGQKVSLELSDHNATRFTGTVAFITAVIDADTKAASVHIALDPTSNVTLLPNMFVSAAIHCEELTCEALPDEAIVMNANRKYIFVSLGSGRFRKQEVVTGLSQQGYTQVTFIDPIQPTDSIVTAKAFYLESMLADHEEDE